MKKMLLIVILLVPAIAYSEEFFLTGFQSFYARLGPDVVASKLALSIDTSYPEQAKRLKTNKFKNKISRNLQKHYKMREAFIDGLNEGGFVLCNYNRRIGELESGDKYTDMLSGIKAPYAGDRVRAEGRKILVHIGPWKWSPGQMMLLGKDNPMLYIVQREQPGGRVLRGSACPLSWDLAKKYISFQLQGKLYENEIASTPRPPAEKQRFQIVTDASEPCPSRGPGTLNSKPIKVIADTGMEVYENYTEFTEEMIRFRTVCGPKGNKMPYVELVAGGIKFANYSIDQLHIGLLTSPGAPLLSASPDYLLRSLEDSSLSSVIQGNLPKEFLKTDPRDVRGIVKGLQAARKDFSRRDQRAANLEEFRRAAGLGGNEKPHWLIRFERTMGITINPQYKIDTGTMTSFGKRQKLLYQGFAVEEVFDGILKKAVSEAGVLYPGDMILINAHNPYAGLHALATHPSITNPSGNRISIKIATRGNPHELYRSEVFHLTPIIGSSPDEDYNSPLIQAQIKAVGKPFSKYIPRHVVTEKSNMALLYALFLPEMPSPPMTLQAERRTLSIGLPREVSIDDFKFIAALSYGQAAAACKSSIPNGFSQYEFKREFWTEDSYGRRSDERVRTQADYMPRDLHPILRGHDESSNWLKILASRELAESQGLADILIAIFKSNNCSSELLAKAQNRVIEMNR